MFRDIKQNLNFEACQARSLTMQQGHLAFSLFAFVVLELQPDLTFNGTIAQTIGEKKSLLSSLLLVKKQGKFCLLDVRKTDTIPVSLQASSFDRVLLSLNSAFEILNYQGAANAA